MPKNWWESWTLWLNIVTLVVLLAGYVADNALSLGIPPQVTGYAVMVVAVGNMLLRVLKTSQPIAGSPPAGSAPVLPH